MKALVLAAGLGTRLLPHTRHIPKPLFRIGGRTLLDMVIERLCDAGCEAVAVNTHHLHTRIADHVAGGDYAVPVRVVHEPEILGTGGAVRNLEDFWDDRPFFVVNSDILADVDLRGVYECHLGHDHPATLVVTDDPEFNTVTVDSDGAVIGFGTAAPAREHLTFTGIQVLSPDVLEAIPEGTPSSIIDAYRRLMAAGKRIMTYRLPSGRWRDLGAIPRFKETAMEAAARTAFAGAFPDMAPAPIAVSPLAGDGSARRWYRLTSAGKSLIAADHGIQTQPPWQEIDSFVHIGRHLHDRDVAVPRIHHVDRFPGLVMVADLGDRHLQTAVLESGGTTRTLDLYRRVLREAVGFWLAGEEGFDPDWTYQTRRYGPDVILDQECRYFMEAFVQGYRRFPADYERLADEFERLAERIMDCAEWALMHRDFQSRNIMIQEERPVFIDFQGARIGPIQYDLASLLIDPYVGLSEAVQSVLVRECTGLLSARRAIDTDRFLAGYRYCALSRNLQILGAFAFLSRVRGKTDFERYIPPAIASLVSVLSGPSLSSEFPKLSRLAADLMSHER